MFVVKTCGATQNPDFPRTGPDRTEILFTGVWNIFHRISGINLNLNLKHAFHSQTEPEEWLLSLISTLHDVIIHYRAYSHIYFSLKLVNFGLMLNRFGPVQAKDNGAFRGRGTKNLARQDSSL